MGVCAEKTIVFFYAYTAGRFYWLLFAIVIHAKSSPWCFFNDARLCVYVAESRMFYLRDCIGGFHSSRRHLVALL